MRKWLTVAGVILLTIATRQFFVRPPPYIHHLGTPANHSPQFDLPELSLNLGFSRAGDYLLSHRVDGKVMRYNVESGAAELVYQTDNLFAWCATHERALIRDSEQVRIVTRDSSTPVSPTDANYEHAAWSQDCATFVLADPDRPAIELWRTSDRSRLTSLSTNQAVRNGVAISANGLFLAAAQGIYDDENGHQTRLSIIHTEHNGENMAATIASEETIMGMWALSFTPDESALIVGTQRDGKSGIARISTADGTIEWQHDGYASYWIRAIAVSPDGRWVVTGDEKGRLRLFDALSGAQLRVYRDSLVLQSVVFSPDGKRLAVSRWDGTIGIIDTTQWSQ